MDRYGLFTSVGSKIGDGIDLIAMSNAPKINGCLLTRRFVVLLGELEEKCAIWILFTRIPWINVVVLHELIGHPTFDLLVSCESTAPITNKVKLMPC